jgi:hypothetical protein
MNANCMQPAADLGHFYCPSCKGVSFQLMHIPKLWEDMIAHVAQNCIEKLVTLIALVAQ